MDHLMLLYQTNWKILSVEKGCNTAYVSEKNNQWYRVVLFHCSYFIFDI